MNDIDHDIDRDADHDRIDALAREAGSALRRPPSPNQLARVHRVKRNRQIARAAGGGLAVVALVAGGVALLQRDADEQLVPATVPASTMPASTVPTSTVPDTAVTTLAPATTVPPLAAAPELLYLGTNDKAAEQVQRVVDLATLEVLRTEPLDDDAWRAYSGWREPRFDSVTGITYALGSYPGDDPADGLPVVDWCGRFPLEVEGAPAGTTALPDRASLISVSEDGRWLLVVGASACPVDGLIEPSMNVEQIDYEQEVRLFDADDPAAPGRLLWTSPYPERQFQGVEWTSDGAWMLVRHLFVDGSGVLQQGLDVIETATGNPLPVDTPGCSILAFAQSDLGFVGDTALAFVERCDDGIAPKLAVAIHALDASQDTQPLSVPIEVVSADSFPTLEVWPGLDGFGVADATFVVTAVEPGGATRTLLGEGSAVRELPFDDDRVSFGPLPEIVGD